MPLDTITANSFDSTAITIAVNANNASTINANTVNFNNSTTVTVSVLPGPSGVANVSFSSQGRVSLGLLFAIGG